MKIFQHALNIFQEYIAGLRLLLDNFSEEKQEEITDAYTPLAVLWRDSATSTYGKIHFPNGDEYVCKFHYESKNNLKPDRVYVLQMSKGKVYIQTPVGKITFVSNKSGEPEQKGEVVIGKKYRERKSGISHKIETSEKTYQEFFENVDSSKGICAMIKVLKPEDVKP